VLLLILISASTLSSAAFSFAAGVALIGMSGGSDAFDLSFFSNEEAHSFSSPLSNRTKYLLVPMVLMK
jgi:hypothetical protein